MTREEAIAILENEKECVNRANKNDYCNRDCYNCELVKTDAEILTALEMAISALSENKGKWVLRNERNTAVCSKCFRLNKDPENFCKYCGADMR